MLTALATGVLFGTRTSLGPSTKSFRTATYVDVQQATIRNLRPVMGVLLPGSAATTAVLLGLTAGEPPSWTQALTLGGLAAQIAALTLTATIELPINSQVLTWSPEAPPPGWETLRDRWDTVHTLRTISSIIGLACLAAAALSTPR